MRILGIDPGSRKAGFGLIEIEGRKIRYLASGILNYDGKTELIERLEQIHASCRKLWEVYQPDELVLESLIHVKNVGSLSKLAQTRGAMIVAFYPELTGKVFEYSPNYVKTAVTGHGHANKEAVEKSLSLMFGKKEFQASDESDALAIAVCHALGRNMPRSQKGSAKKSRSLRDIVKR